MERTFRFIMKNKGHTQFVLTVLIGLGVGTLAVALDATIVQMLPLIILLTIPMVILTTNCGQILQNRALKILNEQCDPYPFLEETRCQCALRNPPHMEVNLKINHAMALRHTGEYQRSWEILHGIHIDKYPSITPVTKAVYYNNLMDILILLGNQVEAEVWYRKAVQIINDLPRKPQKALDYTKEMAIAAHFYRMGDYAAALERIDALQPPTKAAAIELAYFRAQLAVAMEQPGIAREKLEFVIENGNKLYVVVEARELLQSL